VCFVAWSAVNHLIIKELSNTYTPHLLKGVLQVYTIKAMAPSPTKKHIIEAIRDMESLLGGMILSFVYSWITSKVYPTLTNTIIAIAIAAYLVYGTAAAAVDQERIEQQSADRTIGRDSWRITRDQGISFKQLPVREDLLQVPIDEDNWLDGNITQELARQEGRVQEDLIWSNIINQEEKEEVNIEEEPTTPSALPEPWTTSDVFQRMNDVINHELAQDISTKRLRRRLSVIMNVEEFPKDREGFRQAVLSHQVWMNEEFRQGKEEKRNNTSVSLQKEEEQMVYNTSTGTVMRVTFHAEDGIADLTFMEPTSTTQYYMTLFMEKLDEDLLDQLVKEWIDMLSKYGGIRAYEWWNSPKRLLKFGGRVDIMMFTKDNYIHP
jgi:hypothetical protein